MFLGHFEYVLQPKKMSIRSIAYHFGTFVMFSILESVVLFFPKHINFKMFLM